MLGVDKDTKVKVVRCYKWPFIARMLGLPHLSRLSLVDIEKEY